MPRKSESFDTDLAVLIANEDSETHAAIVAVDVSNDA